MLGRCRSQTAVYRDTKFGRTTSYRGRRDMVVKSSGRQVVAVLGGGFAGASLAVKLAGNDNLDVMFISRTDFFEVSFANARSAVEPSIADKIVWPYAEMKAHGKFVQGEVVALTDSTIKLKDGRELAFDVAAIATGSTYAVGKATHGATTTVDRQAEIRDLAKRLKGASKVTIVGGGPLGVELAGEILTDLPGVHVALVQSGPALLPSLPARVGAAAEAWLRSKGCQVVLGDRLEVPAGASGGSFKGTTKGGVQVDCDVLLMATGISVNSSFMKPHLSDALDEQGRIKVDEHLRVVGHPQLFALGDVTNVPEEKLAFLAAQQGTLVASNIAALTAGRKKLRTWSPSMGMQVMFVSVGRNFGVGRIGWLTFTGFIPTRLKSRNIMGFTDKYRQQLLATA